MQLDNSGPPNQYSPITHANLSDQIRKCSTEEGCSKEEWSSFFSSKVIKVTRPRTFPNFLRFSEGFTQMDLLLHCGQSTSLGTYCIEAIGTDKDIWLEMFEHDEKKLNNWVASFSGTIARTPYAPAIQVPCMDFLLSSMYKRGELTMEFLDKLLNIRIERERIDQIDTNLHTQLKAVLNKHKLQVGPTNPTPSHFNSPITHANLSDQIRKCSTEEGCSKEEWSSFFSSKVIKVTRPRTFPNFLRFSEGFTQMDLLLHCGQSTSLGTYCIEAIGTDKDIWLEMFEHDEKKLNNWVASFSKSIVRTTYAPAIQVPCMDFLLSSMYRRGELTMEFLDKLLNIRIERENIEQIDTNISTKLKAVLNKHKLQFGPTNPTPSHFKIPKRYSRLEWSTPIGTSRPSTVIETPTHPVSYKRLRTY